MSGWNSLYESWLSPNSLQGGREEGAAAASGARAGCSRQHSMAIRTGGVGLLTRVGSRAAVIQHSGVGISIQAAVAQAAPLAWRA